MVLLEALKTRVLQLIHSHDSCHSYVTSLNPSLLDKFVRAQAQFGTKAAPKKKAAK